MDQELSHLAEMLRQGQMQSGQTSYERRAPATRALPLLREARTGLRACASAHPEDGEAWRLLSQAEETFLNYRAARESLERAIQASGSHDRHDLKKLALLREYEAKWAELSLSPDQLHQLGQFLAGRLSVNACDQSLRLTEQWLHANGVKRAVQVLKALQCQGGYCDCEVFANVVE
jgi:hypothetical protein